MTYRELIELYKKGSLDEKQREKVEKDIERQEAISDYLFEEGEVPGFDDFMHENMNEEMSEPIDAEEVKFTQMVNASIRKAFVKMGLTVGTVVLVVVFFVIFALPNIVDLFYYNPAEEIIGNQKDATADQDEVTINSTTNRMSLDFSVYSELMLPGYYRYVVQVDENGYAEYDINILQEVSKTGNFTNVAGKIKKNKMIFYDSNLLTKPTGNAFVAYDIGVEGGFSGMGAAGSYKEALKELDELDDDEYYVAYVTLSDVYSYSEFAEWSKAELREFLVNWCAICQKTKDGTYSVNSSVENIGFIYNYSAGTMQYDKEKYPYLTTYDAGITAGEEDKWVVSEEIMTTHVISMLRYMSEQKDFGKMVDENFDGEEFAKIADNVEEHGLYIYGFTVVEKKADILKLSEMDEVAYIYTTPLKY